MTTIGGGAGSSDPQSGKLFYRSHGDCFIHATQWWIKHWNISYTKDGLAIVRVTVLNSSEKVFLATLCPAPLSYESVQRGVNRRQYLEIDPKFALELGVNSGSDVLLESLGEVERCSSLVLAPLTVSDYDKLENFSEKIEYELTERIRVVSCRYSFPIWIDNLVVSVKVVSSQPSANWVILEPNYTKVQLQRDDSVPLNSSVSIVSNSSTPGQPSSSNGSPPPSTSITSTLSLPPTQQTANRQWDFSSEHSRTKPRRKKSTSSNRSSTHSDSSVDTSPMEDSDPDLFGSSISRFASYVGNWIFSREASQAGSEERPSKLEGTKEKTLVSASLDSVGFETRCFPGTNQIGLGKVADVLEESDPVMKQPSVESSQHQMMMTEIKHKVPCYTGPLYKSSGARPGSNTPDPPPMSSMSSESDPTEKTKKSYHKRFNTWHSGTDFKNSSPGFRSGKRPVVPHMCVDVRVQPHPITGVYCLNSQSDRGLWRQDQLFNIFVHPSTIPEIFLYWQSYSTEPILVEIMPTYLPPSDLKESKSNPAGEDHANTKHDTRSVSSETTLASPLPGSLVVRLCFATRIRLLKGVIACRIEDGCCDEQSEDLDTDCIDFRVAVGHVVMSDIVRQQLRIKNCSLVRMLHVKDEWRISYTDQPSVLLQPLKPEHKRRNVEIKNQFEEWVKAVSHVSSIGAVLVDKQIVPVYKNEDGDWVSCRVKINAGSLRRVRPRVRYLLATGHRLSLHVDSLLPHSHSGMSLSKSLFSRQYRDPSPAREETISLPTIVSLNQPSLNIDIEHFKALEPLYMEGVQYLETVFSQTGSGALLVCGVSGAGGSGCGKTSLAKLLCKAVSGHPHYANVILVNCTALRGLNFKKKLKAHFFNAILHQPTVILLDDLDHSTPQVTDPQEQLGEEGNASIRKTQVLLGLLDRVRHKKAQIVVIATAQNKQQLNSDLLQSRGSHIFEKMLEITSPTLADRKLILSSILSSKAMNALSDQDLRTVARRTEGFQSGDLVTLVDKAISLCEIRTLYPQGILSLIPSSPVKPHLSARLHHVSHVSTDGSSSDLEASSKSFSTPPSSPCKKQTFKKPFESNPSLMHTKKMSLASTDSTHTLIQEEGSMFTITRPFEHSVSLSQMKLGVNDFKRALKGFVPVALRGLPLHKSGTIDFSSVGGLKSVKKCLKETLLWPSKYPRLFEQCPIKQRCGVLLYGAPGTGKTLLAGAVAKEFNLNFVSIKGPELLSKYIGASEQAVRDVFTRALCAKPCILFFDEFDSLAPRRGHDNTGVTDRVVNQLLTQLDGVESLQGVYVLAASSRPDLIDPALLRPGRIDRSLLCDMPTQEERKEILENLSAGIPLAPNVDLEKVAAKSEGMTGADLKALLYNAQLLATHQTLGDSEEVGTSHLTQLQETRKTQSPEPGVPSTPTVKPGSGSLQRPLVFKDGVRITSSSLSKSLQSTTLGLQKKCSDIRLTRRKSTLTRDTANEGSLFDKSKRKSITIQQDQLISALSKMQPSLPKQELKKYSQIYDKFTGKTKTSMEGVKPTATMA